jgi:hypothetical protein
MAVVTIPGNLAAAHGGKDMPVFIASVGRTIERNHWQLLHLSFSN